MEKYTFKIKDKEFTIPKQNIVAFALYQALFRGVSHGDIHDDKTAIEYLSSLGIEVQNA